MLDFMKTIISAIQTWTNGKLKESVADWNQNDETAQDYVKNRTHYNGNVKKQTLFENSVQFDESGYAVIVLTLEDGVEYTVEFEGEKYILTPFKDPEGNLVIGNPLIWWGEEIEGVENNEIPFAMGHYVERFICDIYATEEFSNVFLDCVKIEAETEEIKQINHKYIPFSIKNMICYVMTMVYDIFSQIDGIWQEFSSMSSEFRDEINILKGQKNPLEWNLFCYVPRGTSGTFEKTNLPKFKELKIVGLVQNTGSITTVADVRINDYAVASITAIANLYDLFQINICVEPNNVISSLSFSQRVYNGTSREHVPQYKLTEVASDFIKENDNKIKIELPDNVNAYNRIEIYYR